MKKKRILAFTSIRSDYDLMSSLFMLLNKDKEIDLRLIVSGAHLSKTDGFSIENIKKDELKILIEIESLIDADTKSSRAKTASILFQNSIDPIRSFNPDLIIFAGDREDTIIAAIIAGYLNIPSLHFYGGDHASDGNIDNSVRHAVSKLSSIHFVSNTLHKNRLIKMGENPNRIYVIGSLALDKFKFPCSYTKKQIREYFNIKNGFDEFAILIYHPIISESETAYKEFENILKALINQKIYSFISFPNTDAGNKKIIDIIKKYQQNIFFVIYNNLHRSLFLSLFKHAKFIIGNSSAGIVEAASIPIPAINVGRRQIGRYCTHNVVFSDGDIKNIEKSILRVCSTSFINRLKNIKNPYGDGKSSYKAYELIKKINFSKYLLKNEDPINL